MRIIAVNVCNYHNSGIESAVALLSATEIETLLGWPHSDIMRSVRPGSELLICERILHALKTEQAAKGAIELPSQLRALATMLEMHHPAIKAVVDPPKITTTATAG